ncbi:MAG: iron-sulfur cluster assembly accessory protein [Proteobacteria bacterium]|jgi:iron-sulfur cluster assembly accessory protein|nr:iron-sulfur cluster assembly accessory protein [Pseudomonadota bacterium]MCG6934918.1 iron-sulfur cluster assembly accessory protein [Pseudomonadota bacterium]
MTQATAASYSPTISAEELKVSPLAAEQLAGLMSNPDVEAAGIRVFVSGGGCSGMTYGMTYAESISERDKVLEGEGFKIIADPVALNYLKGCDIDFSQDGLNASFVFNNVFQSVGGSGTCGACGATGGGCA